MSWADEEEEGKAGEKKKTVGLRARNENGVFPSFSKSFSFLNSTQFQMRTKPSINTIQNTLFSSNINEPILGKFFENNFLNSFIF